MQLSVTWPEAFMWVGITLSAVLAMHGIPDISIKFGGRHYEHVHYHNTDDDPDDLCSNLPNVPEAVQNN